MQIRDKDPWSSLLGNIFFKESDLLLVWERIIKSRKFIEPY